MVSLLILCDEGIWTKLKLRGYGYGLKVYFATQRTTKSDHFSEEY